MEDVAPAVLDLQGIGLGDVSDRKLGREAGGTDGTNATALKNKVRSACFVHECTSCYEEVVLSPHVISCAVCEIEDC